MANKEKVLGSGAVLNMTSGCFKEGHTLFKAVMTELGSLDGNLELNTKLRIKLISSENIERALWPCMARCTYNKVKVVPEMFDNVEGSIDDFLDIALEVLGFNLDPFFKSQNSRSKEVPETDVNTQR